MFLKCYRESSLGSSYDIKITETNAKSSNYTVRNCLKSYIAVKCKAGEWKYTLENSKRTVFRARAPQTFFSF